MPLSLYDILASAAPLDGRIIGDATRSVPLADLLTKTGLDASPAALGGRRVLLAPSEQFTAALALVALDGLAERIVLCPPDLKPEHYAAIIETAAIDTVVIDAGTPPLPDRPGLRVVGCRWPLAEAGPVQRARATEWLLMTSGTTGVPKMVSHGLAGLSAAIKPATTGKASVWATFYDIRRYGGLQIFLRGLLGSGSLVLSNRDEPVADYLQRLGRAGVTHLSGTPSHWRRALMSPAIGAIAPDYVRLSGEIADQTVLDSLRRAFPQAGIGHAYASTEAGVGFEVDDGREGFPDRYVGAAQGPVHIRVVEGTLQIRSNRAASGYVGPGGALHDAEGFVDTGDMVEHRGDRYHFVGRRGGIINVGGLKVHPEEIEAVINRHREVRMSLVQGRRNPITGAIVMASVMLKERGAEAPQDDALRDEILAECRKSLPPHKVPALLRFVAALDVTPAGKLVRPHG